MALANEYGYSVEYADDGSIANRDELIYQLNNGSEDAEYDVTEQVGWTDDAEKTLDKMPLDKRMEWDRANDSNYSEPWSDVKQNWSYDRPVPGPSVKDTIRLRDQSGKEADYAYDSPQAKEVFKRIGDETKNSPATKAFINAFQKGAEFNANRPYPYTNLATSDSTNDFTDPVKLGQYDVDFPEQTIDNFDYRTGQITQKVIPSPNNPNAPFQKPVDQPAKPALSPADALGPGEEIVPPTNAVTRSMNVKTDPNSKFVLWDPAKQRPVTQADQKRSAKDNAKDSSWPPPGWREWDQKTQTLRPAKQAQSFDSPSIPANPRPGSWQELAKLNNITDPRKLQAGTRINTPDGGSIYVNKGDTLSGIAQKMRGVREGRMVKGPAQPTLVDEGNPVPGQNFTTSQGQQMNWNPTTKSWASTGPAVPSDGFDVVSNVADMRTTDTGNKHNQTYTSTTIQKNPTTGQQKSLSSWSHDDPVTGKNYSGTNYIDPEGNAQTQKNYQESVKESNSRGPVTHRIGLTVTDPNHPMVSKRKEPYQKSVRITQDVPDREAAINQAIAHYRRKGYKVHDHHYIGTVDNEPVNELNKNTVASWVRQQPQRIKGDTGLSRTDFKKAKRLVDKSIPSALSKIKDPGYGQQNPRLEENIADDMAAMAQKKFPNAYISKNGQEVQKPKNWGKPHTPPPVDQDKQRRDLADKYPNIDELVRQAELRRDPYYDRAEGNAYYAGRDAEHNYHRLKQIQRMIRGAELDEMNFGGVGQTTNSDTGDITTNFNQGPVSVSQTKTPGGYTKQTNQQFNLGNATLAAKTVGPNIGAGQLAGTTTKTATNTATGQAKQQVKGVGFGGATGANVGKNYVGSSDDELAKYAADSTFGVNEETTPATLNTPVGDFTANITKDKSTNTVSGTMPIGGTTLRATKDMTPGGAQSFSVDKDVTPNLNLSATKKSADYNKGQLAGTRSVAAKYTDATGALGQPGQQHTATRTMGVGFGGASGANVGKNYVDQYSVNESIDRIRHLAGIKPVR
jgi:hypothetical protein